MWLEGTFRVSRERMEVFAFLRDARQWADCLEDPHTLEVLDPEHFQGTLTTGISFLRGTFRFRGEYGNTVPGTRLEATVDGSGMGSGLKARLSVGLVEEGGQTRVDWKADVTFFGPVATLGEGVIRRTVDRKVAGLFENARKRLEATA